MSTGIFIPITKCVHDIPYHGWTHDTDLSSSSSLVFTGDILNSRNLSCRDHIPCSWFRVWNYNLQLNRPISQLIKLRSKWAVGQLPYGKEKLHLRIPTTLQKTLVGINYLEMFLMSKNIYMKHECQNTILQLSLPWVFGFQYWNCFAALFLTCFQRVSPFFLDRSLSILQLNQD